MIKLFYTKQITENWTFDIELLKWFGSPGWFPIYENSLSAKIKALSKQINKLSITTQAK